MPSSKTLLNILTIGLYVLPLTLLVYLQSVIYPFVTIKVYSFQALVEILFAVWIILVLFYKQYRPKITWLSIFLFGFTALLVLTAALGVNPHRSFWSMQERGMGVVALIHFFVLYLMLQSLHATINWRKYFLYIFTLSVFTALFAVIQQFLPSIFYVSASGRPGSFFGNPSFLAAFLLFTVFLGFWLAKGTIRSISPISRIRPIGRIALIAGSLFEIAIIFNTNTRGAILGLVAGVGLMLLLSKKRKLALYGLGALVAFGLIVVATRGAAIWQSIPGLDRLTQISLTDTTTAHRLIIWKSALDAAKERPILGWGFENFRTAFDSRYDPTLLRSGFGETFFDKPHNVFLELLVSGGVVTLLLYLAVLVALARVLWKYVPPDFRAFGLAALAAYVVQNVFVFDTFGSYLMFFILLAFADGFSPPARIAARSVAGGPVVATEKTGPVIEPIGRIRRMGLIKGVASLAAALAMFYLVLLNAKIIYANHQQYLGLNYFVHNYPEQGLAAFDKGLAINQPYRNELRIMFLQTLSQMTPVADIPSEEKYIDQAIAEAEKAIAAEPDNYAWHLALADSRTFFQATNIRFLKGADEEIAQAIAISPKRQQNYYVTAKLAWLEKGVAAALAEMKHAVDLDPESGDPHFYYGLLAYQMGNEKLALDELEKARLLGRTPQTPGEYKLVAGYYGDAEKYDIAVQYFLEANRLDPSDIEVKLKLGIVYVYMGKPELAKPFFEDALKTNPEIRSSSNWANLKPLFDAAGVRY